MGYNIRMKPNFLNQAMGNQGVKAMGPQQRDQPTGGAPAGRYFGADLPVKAANAYLMNLNGYNASRGK